ncbi:MAG: nucleotide exchange factor GrpE [Candidatus Nanopelagicaceae bacterium]
MTDSHPQSPEVSSETEISVEEEAQGIAAEIDALTSEAAELQSDVSKERDLVADLTADLQRLQAEYSNYRKRVERDRALAHEIAVSSVLNELLPILDDLERAESHGELTGGFKAVADQLISITSRIGLVRFGEAPSTFDPNIHDAMMHETSDEVTETTVTAILQPGYKFKERIVRPARVTVTDPTS